jgi:hypothetical protein
MRETGKEANEEEGGSETKMEDKEREYIRELKRMEERKE